MSDVPVNALGGGQLWGGDGDVVEARDLAGGFQFRYGRGSETARRPRLPSSCHEACGYSSTERSTWTSWTNS